MGRIYCSAAILLKIYFSLLNPSSVRKFSGSPIPLRTATYSSVEFLNASLSMLYLLNFRYEPFYKWQFAGAEGLVAMGEAMPYLKDIASGSTRRDDVSIANDIEAVCAIAVKELELQGLTEARGDYMEPHAYSIMEHISDETVRNLHVMEG